MLLKKVIKIGQNSALVFASVCFALVATELLLRLTDVGKYSLYDRVLFFTNPSLVEGKNKAVKYSPNTTIRSVAIYGDHVDYDANYQTNNLGFIDNVDYDLNSQATKHIVFVGDSFTAGDGGSQPWVSQVRESLGQPNIDLYNFGVTGTGLHHFKSLLESFRGVIPFDEVNIMVISNDFFRTQWRPITKGDGLWFCGQESEKDCLENSQPVIHIINQQDSQGELVAYAEKVYQSKQTNENNSQNFLQKLRLYRVFCDIYSLKSTKGNIKHLCPHLKVYQENEYSKNELYANSIDVLKAIKNDFPDVTFRIFHIPEKGEVFENQYSLEIEQDIKKIGLEYIPLLQTCPWNRAMYHKHDPHLNDLGYGNLANCMAGYVE